MNVRVSLHCAILLCALISGGISPHGAEKISDSRAGVLSLFGPDTMPPVTVIVPDRRSISPNYDGRADTVAFSVSVSDRSAIGGWKLQILDAGRALVREYGTLPNERYAFSAGGLFGGRGVPGSIVWDGTDSLERVVSDGSYTYSFFVWDEYDNVSAPIEGVIAVDTVPPVVEIKKKRYALTPRSGAGPASLEIEVKVSSDGPDRCVAGILAPGGKVVRDYEWSVAGIPRTVSWDGLDKDGKPVPEGAYVFYIECVDAAENRTRRQVRNIAVSLQGDIADINTQTEVYSNNRGGNIEFETFLSRRAGLTGWTITVATRGGTPLFQHAGHSALPVTFRWNGKTTGGRDIDDGVYHFSLAATYGDGTAVASLPKEIIFDSAGPRVTVGRSPGTFSPDGKGGYERLVISPWADDPSDIAEWFLSVNDAKGESFRVFSGKGAPAGRIEWGGVGGLGKTVESGSVYSLQLVATDTAGNTAASYQVSFNVDVLVLPAEFGYHMSVGDVDFEVRDGTLRLKNAGRLARVASILKSFPRYAVVVEGYIDAAPAGEKNLKLSEQFAREAMAYLAERGVARQRLSYRGMGDIALTGAGGERRGRRIDFLLRERDVTE